MKIALLALLLGLAPLSAGTLVFSDNFNAPDTADFDNSVQTNRRSGLLGPAVQLRSFGVQLGILGNQLNFLRPGGGSGKLGFVDAVSLPAIVLADFAAGPAGSTIIAEGGMKVSFDWLPANNFSDDWVCFSAGISTGEAGLRVNHSGTDFGILFRNRGATQFFDNGAGTTGNSFPVPTVATRKVVITLAFSSFADNSSVVARATVDGISVLPDGYTFPWEGNLGIQNLELGNFAAGTKIDNLAISGLGGLSTTLATQPFYSSITNNATVGTLVSEADDVPEPATYTFVAGEGGLDNNKFKIAGNMIQSNGFNFQSLPDGASLSVRIKGTGTNSNLIGTQVFLLTVVKDSDSDDLPDSWELSKGVSLAALNGRKTGPGPGADTGDFDGDTFTDLQEFEFSQGLYPLLNPTLADTDSDGLQDALELTPAGLRPPTNPTIADTDADGLNDLLENNTGSYVSGADPGTNPADYDSDNDNFPDGYEIARGSNPLDLVSIPALPAPFSTAILTTDEASGVEASKTYTHAISGGYAVTINGVSFASLTAGQAPPNFTWTATDYLGQNASYNQMENLNFGQWSPAGGNVTGTGLLGLFGGFTYSGSGDRRGSAQTFTLAGLTPGQKYEVRLYIRVWDNGASGRPISVTFANGSQSSNAYVLEDRPGVMLGDGNANSAYALVLPYTAQGPELIITAAVPQTTTDVSGSWHLYGLTNESLPGGSFAITSLELQATPSRVVTLRFNSTPGAVYAVEYSTALNAAGLPGGWIALTSNLPSQGASTTYTDNTAAGPAPRIFYRIRRIP